MKRFISFILCLLFLAVLNGCGNEEIATDDTPLVKTKTISLRAGASEGNYPGAVKGRYETTMSFQVGGRILQRYVQAGDYVHAGDVLKFGFACAGGCRGYIAFAGGLDIPLVMGSKSTLASKKLGGYEGRTLQKGDKIGFSAPKSTLDNMEKRKVPTPVYPTDEVTLRVVLGPQEDAFSEEEQRKFFWYSSTVTSEFDRQGCRLQREVPVKHLKDGNIISDGIAFGSIQVPTTGQPFIMMADRQTVGGYTKIGTVITVDLPKIAQAKPGMKIRFVQVSMELAHLLYSRELEELKQLDEALNH